MPASVGVFEATDPPGRHDRSIGGRAHVAQEVDVRTFHRPVLMNVSDDVSGAPCRIKTTQRLPQIAAFGRPPSRGQRVSANIESDGYPITVLSDHLFRPIRILERCGSKITRVHPGHAAAGPSSRIPQIALSVLTMQFVDLTDGGAPIRGESGVQIDRVIHSAPCSTHDRAASMGRP